tara:strand:- start:3690 stop:9284 length:5595 start_codon:yes stop_codon:yes gene_type:complete
MSYKGYRETDWLDAALNSTIGIPQQLLWRLWRVYEDEEVGLFDEEGLMDLSLLPVVGWLDGDRKDVLEDEMSDRLGWGDSWYGQLGAAIATDPLTYLSGGLTALGKGAVHGSKLSRMKAVKPALQQAAKASGKELPDFVRTLKHDELLKLADDALKGKRGLSAKLARRKANQFRKVMPDAMQIAKRKELGELTMGALAKHQSARHITLGLPGLKVGRGKWAVSDQYSSWLKYGADTALGKGAFDQVKQTKLGGSAAKFAHMFVHQKLLELPYVRASLANTSAPFRHLAGGAKVGGEALAEVKGAHANLSKRDQLRLHRLFTTDATDLVADLHKSLDKHGPDVISDIGETYHEAIRGGAGNEEAFLRAMRSYGISARGENASQVWGRLIGEGKDHDKFPKWGRGGREGKQRIKKVLKRALAEHAEGTKVLQSGIHEAPQASKLGNLAKVLGDERKDLIAPARWASEIAFELGQKTQVGLNRVFRTGSDGLLGKKARQELTLAVARDNNFRENLAHGIYSELHRLSETSPNFSQEDSAPILRFLLQLDFMPDELAASFKAMKANPSELELAEGVFNANERMRSSFMMLQEMLKNGGIRNPATRQALTRLFKDDVFPLFDLGLHGEKDGKALFGQWSRLLEDKYVDVLDPTVKQADLLKRPANGHILRGMEVPNKAGNPVNILGKARAGRTAGTLTNDEIAETLGQIRKQSERLLTDAEVYAKAEEIAVVKKFAKTHGLTVPEVTEMLRARRVTVSRDVERADPLWEAGRTGWSTDSAVREAERYGLEIWHDSVDGFYFKSSRGLADSTLRRQGLKGAGKGRYGTYREAMDDAREFLDKNEKYRTKYGPQPRPQVDKVRVGEESVDDLRAALAQTDDGGALFKTGNKAPRAFDDAYMPRELESDFAHLTELERRRALPKDHQFHERHLDIKTRKRLAERTDPASPEELRVAFRGAGVDIPEEMMHPILVDYARGHMLMDELKHAHRRAARRKEALDIHPELLNDLEMHLTSASDKIKTLVLRELGTDYRKVFKRAQFLTNKSYQAARASGTWLPGSPIGYLARFFTQEQQERAATLIGRVNQEDQGILMRLGVKQAQKFERRLDQFTLDDLNAMSRELETQAKTTASPGLKQLAKELDDFMEEAGVGLKSMKQIRWQYTGKTFEDDPFLGIVQRFGNAQNEASLTGYFDKMFDLSTGKNGESYMFGGKVIGIIDSSSELEEVKSLRSATVRTTKRSKETGRQAALALKEGEEASPMTFVIEMADGSRKYVENDSIKLSGGAFGLMPLSSIERAEQLTGKRPSVGQSFADSMLRSDILESVYKKGLTRAEAEGLIGKQVVYGNVNMMHATVKAAQDVHRVTPAALRTFDAVNYFVKTFQTIARLPFHIANLSSGVFQTQLAGVGPKNTLLGYTDAMRLLFGKQEFIKQSELMSDMMGGEVSLKSWGVKSLWTGDQNRALKFAEAHGDSKFVEDYYETFGTEFDNVEDLVYSFADGAETNLLEVFSEAGKKQLFGTHAGDLARGSRTADEGILRQKYLAVDRSLLASGKKLLKGQVKEGLVGGGAGFMERWRNRAEQVEILNRTATVFGLLREGYTVPRAIEIAKSAHVPYEQLTHFEKQYLKRFITYYTFPRHYMPWAWSKFAENPAKLSRIKHAIQSDLVDTTEGRPNLVLGDYRFDLGRLNANVEAAALLAGFADKFAAAGEMLVPGTEPNYMRKLNKAYSDAGLTTIGGPLAPFLGTSMFSEGARTNPRGANTWEEAVSMIWPLKVAAVMSGKMPSREEYSAQLQYTPMELWLTDPVVGIGMRKVRPEHETQMLSAAFQKELRSMQMKMAAAKSPERRAHYQNQVQRLAAAYSSLVQGTQRKVFK